MSGSVCDVHVCGGVYAGMHEPTAPGVSNRVAACCCPGVVLLSPCSCAGAAVHLLAAPLAPHPALLPSSPPALHLLPPQPARGGIKPPPFTPPPAAPSPHLLLQPQGVGRTQPLLFSPPPAAPSPHLLPPTPPLDPPSALPPPPPPSPPTCCCSHQERVDHSQRDQKPPQALPSSKGPHPQRAQPCPRVIVCPEQADDPGGSGEGGGRGTAGAGGRFWHM